MCERRHPALFRRVEIHAANAKRAERLVPEGAVKQVVVDAGQDNDFSGKKLPHRGHCRDHVFEPLTAVVKPLATRRRIGRLHDQE